MYFCALRATGARSQNRQKKACTYIVMIRYIIQPVDVIEKGCLENVGRIRKPRFQYSASQ